MPKCRLRWSNMDFTVSIGVRRTFAGEGTLSLRTTSSSFELGGWAIGKTKPFLVGKRAIDVQVAKGVARRLVGFATRAR